MIDLLNIVLLLILLIFAGVSIYRILKSGALLKDGKLNKKQNPVFYYSMLVFLFIFAFLLLFLLVASFQV